MNLTIFNLAIFLMNMISSLGRSVRGFGLLPSTIDWRTQGIATVIN